MLKSLATSGRRLVTQEQYVLVIRCNDGIFIVNKSFFGGWTPIRMPFQSSSRRSWQLVGALFSQKECTQHVSVPSKGLSFKTTILVCIMQPAWKLNSSSVLAQHVVSLSVIKEQKPAHARLVAQACEDANRMLAKAA